MRINRFSKNSAVITLSRPSVLLHPAHIATLHAEDSAVITKVKHKSLKYFFAVNRIRVEAKASPTG